MNSFFKIRIFLKKKTQQQQENVQERGQSPSHEECISLLCISFFLSFLKTSLEWRNEPRLKKGRKEGKKEGGKEERKKERKNGGKKERKRKRILQIKKLII